MVFAFRIFTSLVAAQVMGRIFGIFDIGGGLSYKCNAFKTGTSFGILSHSKSSHTITRCSFQSPSRMIRAPESHRQPSHDAIMQESAPFVPATMPDALATFFSSKDIHGPRLVTILLLVFMIQRIQMGWTSLSTPLDDLGVAMSAIIFWWFQEHFMHKHLLHSNFNWIGKQIHHEHHEKPYHHVSIDPAPLMLGWFTIVHLLLRYVLELPLHLTLTASITYGIAGLFYEWTHYIVHTRVRFPRGSYWEHVKNHHARHHLVNNNHWFAFSLTQIDDIFGTNPKVSEVSRTRIS